MMDGTKPIATRTWSRVDLFCIAELEKRKKHKGNSYAGSSQCRSGGKSKDGYDKVLVLDFDVNDLNVEDKSRSSERFFEPVSDEGSCFQRKNCVRSYLDRERVEGERRSGSVDLDRRRHYGFHKKRLEKGKDVDFDDCTTDDDDDSYVDDDNDVDEYDKADGASENADDGDDVDYDHREGEDGDNDGVYDDEEEETNGENDDYDEDYINYVKVVKPDFVEKKCEGREGGFVKSSSSSYDRGREEEEERHFGSVDWRMDSDLQRKKLEQNKIEIIAIDDSEINDGDDNEVKGGGKEGGFINRKRSSISWFDEKGAEERETQFGSVDLRGDSGLQRNTLEQEKIEIIDIRDGDDDNEVKGGGFINRKRSLKSYFDGDGEEEGERHFSSADLRRDSGLQSKMLDRGKNEINNIDDCNINAGDDNEGDGNNDDDNGGTDGDDVGRCDDDEDDGDSDASNANNDGNDNSDGCDDTDYAGDYEDDDGDDDYGDADRDNAAAEGGGTHAAEYDAGLQYDIRTGSGDGSNDYDSGTNGRGLLAVDSKYKPKETKRGMSGGLKNHKEGFPITLAIKVPNISSNVNNENKNNTSADPERKQYNGEEVPVKYTDAKFFIIKASSTANLYKSLKYSLWSSTSAGNKKLDVGYQEAQEKSGNCPVFLFFSVNSSGQFVGLAEMVGPVENGFFRVKWHIIKDIPSNLLKHITLENNHNKPVTESQDTQEVTLKNGLQMLKIFEDHSCNLQDMHFD